MALLNENKHPKQWILKGKAKSFLLTLLKLIQEINLLVSLFENFHFTVYTKLLPDA